MAKKKELLKKLSVTKLKKLAKEKNVNVKKGMARRFSLYYALWTDKELLVDILRTSRKVKIADIEKYLGKKPTKKTRVKRRRIYTFDKKDLLLKQKGLCAYKKCAELHGKRQKVTVNNHLDHKIPIALWRLKGNKGDPNQRSNLQLLCPGCHSYKTSEDRKKIAKYKRKLGIK